MKLVGHLHKRLIPYGEKINDENVSIDIYPLRGNINGFYV